MSLVISREDLKTWLDSLLKEHTVYAPAAVEGVVLFRAIDSANQVAYRPGNATIGPKECLFPLSHTLFTVESKDGVSVVPAALERDAVIFGLRPCDAQGFAVFDLPMLEEPADQFYKERRERTALVGIACATAGPGCFCTSTGGGPQDPGNLDVMLTEVPEGFIVQVQTEKGRRLIQRAPLKESSAVAPPPPEMPRVPASDIVRAMRKAFKDQYWDRVADRCTHCNICSYVCPTCYCFDMRDYQQEGKVHRVRSWESCQAPGFTKLAGGHDPRGEKGAKVRQRFAHKLFYFPQEFGGVLGCTGCGRCVRQCPVNIDIREVIGDVQKIGGG
ncbi:MAG: 4Fe-4S dicluster domain-containing protein [Chloroflexi bacterium]|nr:4Fe-4S dicluster domain-containing protein [Chloroflexota bacterium]